MSKLSDAQRIEIINKYKTNNYTLAQLSREYGIRGDSIADMLVRRNIKLRSMSDALRRYKDNHSFFDKIDNEEKAYFLGLMYADGYNNEQRGTIKLSLSEIDKDILEKFQKAIESNRPLHFYSPKSKNMKQQSVYSLCINSKYLSKSLSNLGCMQRKTFILEFPTVDQVPECLLRHFVRGYFDGDGCFCITTLSKERNNHRQYSVNITSTENFCKKLHEIIAKELSINSFFSTRFPERNNSTRSLNIGGNRQVRIFLDWIYKDCNVYMNRKYNKYQSIL
jgi:hypothetical protein